MLVKQQLATQEAEFSTLFTIHYQTLYVFYIRYSIYTLQRVHKICFAERIYKKVYSSIFITQIVVRICQTKEYHIVVPFIKK